MTFTTEQILQMIGVITPLVGGLGGLVIAWGVSIKRRAEAASKERIAQAESARLKAEAEAETVKAEAARVKEESEAKSEAVKKAAEGKLIEARSQADTQKRMIDLFESQQLIIGKMDETNKRRDEEHLSRYGTVIGVTRDINIQLVNISNALLDMVGMQKSMQTALAAISPQITASSEAARQSVREAAADVVAQVRVAVAAQPASKPLEVTLVNGEGEAIG